MRNSFDVIKASHALKGEREKLRAFYDAWARRYNTDVANEDYRGPEVVAALAEFAAKAYLSADKAQLEVLDAGCGTGLVGLALGHAGFRTIDGNDLSHEMVEVARRTKAYRTLKGGVDLGAERHKPPARLYDVVVCCGVFTVGHVSPGALRVVASYAKPSGVLVVSTRNSYLEDTDFRAVSERICAAGQLDLISSVRDARYITEEPAHYWIYRMLDNALHAAPRSGTHAAAKDLRTLSSSSPSR